MFEYDFMRTAFAASGVAAVLAGTVGFFLVLRGQTFAGHALSHAGFAGATGAVLFGLSPFAGLVGFTFLAGVGMGLFGEKLAHRDVAIGMMLSSVAGPRAALSAFLHLGRDPSRGAAVRQRARRRHSSALLNLVVLAGLSLIALALIGRPLVFASLQADLAEARGVPLRFVSAAFLGIVAVAVAECAQIVGVLLVFTLMVGPAAAAMNLTRRLPLGVALSAGARDRRSLGRTDARLLHRLANLLLDHRALWHGVLRRGGGEAIRGVGRGRPSSGAIARRKTGYA